MPHYICAQEDSSGYDHTCVPLIYIPTNIYATLVSAQLIYMSTDICPICPTDRAKRIQAIIPIYMSQ